MRAGAGWSAAGPFLIAALTFGCATTGAPPTIRPPTPAPSTWRQAGAEGSAAVAETPEDLSRWWRSFDDALLTSLIERSLSASLDLRTAQARLRAARAQRGLAATGLLPSLAASASASSSKTSGDSAGSDARELYNAGLDASWEPDVFGGKRRAVSAAQADLEAAEAGLRDTQVSLVAEVALNYVELRSSQARLKIASENLIRQSETLDLTTWRSEAGLTSSLDVEQSRANLEQTRAQIPSIETSLAESAHRLAILIGQAPGSLSEELVSSGPIPRISERVAVGIPADTLRQRPDVRAAERRLAAEIARLGEARAARFPSLRLSGSIGVSAATPGGLFDAATTARSILAGLTAPIFDRARIRRQIDVQDAAREQALIAYEKAVLAALEDVENALVSLANARRRRESLAAAAEAARNAALLARHRYTSGLADFQTVLDTERSVLSIEDGLQSSEAAGASALIRLYKALGGGWSPSTPAESIISSRSEES
ncbi:MAG: efflux transporter outer membrane subunit [Vicinamibacteria bacterium]|nr:efflux transporter outer membrane subunit [Vicinamibacteria bacterium]